ncbi:McrB family protein [Lishizhenia sp.]|uniref:McrB family protein n=1 Tax=Lishizhenia sp. TaxID=2497594 RepID=UPI00299D69D8|nr:AAA family ATPase [Lishizhenia sp.]MDX1447019.1 AAA family ATPase [Lishizhenia sp.]
MYFSEEFVLTAYKGLKNIDPSIGKSRQEKVSALRHLLASCELMKSYNTELVNLKVNENKARADFIKAVSRIVALDEQGNYTVDFDLDFAERSDYGVRSNFFTTRLKDSRSHSVEYPGRPKALLHMDNEVVSLTKDINENLKSAFNIEEIRAYLVLWLFRGENFSFTSEKISSSELVAELDNKLKTIYPSNIANLLVPTDSELANVMSMCSTHLANEKANLGIILSLQAEATDESTVKEKAHVLENNLSDADEVYVSATKLLERGSKGILLSGPPGTSKTWYALKLAMKLTDGDFNRISRVQFHQSYSYEDFIEGLVATGSIGGTEPLFKPKFKTFVNLCLKAKNDIDNNYYLIIDEFTRGDPSRIFGELLTYIEADYRDIEFILPYSEEKFYVPQNVIILATMNPYDKSVIDLDAAMERRFEIIELAPNRDILTSFLTKNSVSGPVIGKIVNFFNTLNRYAEHGFGHTYFKDIKSEEDLIILWNHKLKFILEKMFKYKEDALKEVRNSYLEVVSEEGKGKIK